MFWPFGILGFNFLAAGVLLFALGVRSRTGLALSQWWGVRTKRTMVDAETFAKANRAAWRSYIFQGCASFVAGLAILILGIVNSEAFISLVAIAVGATLVILVATIYGYVKAHRSIQ